jgi:hypothetical protein
MYKIKFLLFIFVVKIFLSCCNVNNIINVNSNKKLCINCKHFIDNNPNKELGHCGKFTVIDNVTGKKIYYPVIYRRQSSNLCDVEGKGYVDKNSNETTNTNSDENIIKPIKLCINCKYFLKDNLDINYGKCIKFTNNFYSTNKFFNLASVARDNNNLCGKDGKYYEK